MITFQYTDATNQNVRMVNGAASSIIAANLMPQGAVIAAYNVNVLAPQAQAALEDSDRTVIRCASAGVSVPSAWQSYRTALRNLVNGTDTTSTSLPTAPAYPAGT